MRYTAEDISDFDRQYRVNFINSLPGFKPACLIGTIDETGSDNLALFSSVVCLGASPPLLGMVSRPVAESHSRHTYHNIKAAGLYSINAVTASMAHKAHQTSARFARGVSEFDACGFERCYIPGFRVPCVEGSPLKIICRLQEEHFVKTNGTIFLVGSVEAADVGDGLVDSSGYIDLCTAQVVSVSSLEGYHPAGAGERFAYAKPDSTPNKKWPE